MKKFLVVFTAVLIFGCSNPQPNSSSGNEQFSKELAELKEYFQIPGIAVLIKEGDQTLYEDYVGLSDIERKIPMDSTTTIPMASLTKIFTGILILQLVDEGKVSLDDPVRTYIQNGNIPDSIRIKHILSHTSQGELGKNFYYNNRRFMLLGQIIENVSEKSFKSNINDKIIEPLDLAYTYLLEDSVQVANENIKIAIPYFLGGEAKDGYQEKIATEGFIDYGYSAAAGISSTVRDLAKFSSSLDNDELMTNASKDSMFSPFQPNLPYGLGIFSQELMGEKLVWGYGQYDYYSSLLLKVPDKDLVFVIAANNNLMSDPARLIAGDVSYSLFALSFLKNFVFDLKSLPLMEDVNTLMKVGENVNDSNREFYLKKLLGQSVAASFMSRFNDQESEMSKKILRQVFDIYADHTNYGDLVLMHNLNILKSMDSFRGKGEFSEFDKQFIDIGKSLLKIDPYNPYANYYMANFYQSEGTLDSTSYYFNQIVNAKNFESWWYTMEAEKWITNNKKAADNK